MGQTYDIRSYSRDLAQIVREAPGRVALVNAHTDQSMSYGVMAATLERYAALFRRHGLQEGDTLLAIGPNCAEFLLAFLATARQGLGFAPLSTESPPSDVDRWIGLVKPKLAFLVEGTPEPLIAAVRAHGLDIVMAPQSGAFDWLPPSEGAAPGRSGRLYLTTSGSTGEPKVLVFDTDTLWSSACAFVGFHRALLERRRFWNILPMSYLGGLFNLGLIPLAAGGSVAVGEAFSGRSFLDFWQNVERFEVEVLWLVPTIVRGLLALAQRTRRAEIAGGHHKAQLCLLGTAPIDLATKLNFERTFDIPLLENFALSETTFLTSETLAGRKDRLEGSVGEKLPYVDLRGLPGVPDETDETGGEAPTQIAARSPYLFVGYMDATGKIERPLSPDGYLATGDLGRLADNGQWIVTGRQRDIIKKGGYFVALTEIETLARTHQDVEEAAAVGVAHSFYGEDYDLYVKFAAGAEADDQALGQWLRQRLAKYKWPNRIVAVADFPKTSSGKLRKHLLAKADQGARR